MALRGGWLALVLVAGAAGGRVPRSTVTYAPKEPGMDYAPWVAKATPPAPSFLSRQPDRCTNHVQTLGAMGNACSAFGKSCASTANCNTNNCYEGKCGMGTSCRPHGEKCFSYAPHVCCTGECKGVAIKADCLRILGLSADVAAHKGINVDRQCENLGMCNIWPGMPPPPGPMSTPWAVPVADLAQKYYNLPGISFTPDAVVDTNQFIARQEGQTREGVAPDSTEPGTVRDAGLLFFTSDSEVSTELWGKYEEGVDNEYCVSPITRAGIGGGYFAVGKNCCSKEHGFECGDVAGNSGKSCLAISSQHDKYTYAVQALDVAGANKYKGDGKGIKTPRPIFCRWVEDYVAEAAVKAPEDTFFTFKTLAPTVYCVAAITSKAKGLPAEQQFWAVGTNCCSPKGGFHCGDVADPNAHSGATDVDASGQLYVAVKMGELQYGWKTAKTPLFVSWTAKRQAEDPSGVKVEVNYGTGVMGVTSANR